MSLQTAHSSKLDRAFDALSDTHRRQILVSLRDAPLGVDSGIEPGEVVFTTEVDASLESRFRHVHLPKLADAGYVRWERGGTDAIRRGPRFAEIAPLLRLFETHRADLPDSWP